MKLYIDGKEAAFSSDFDVNMTFKFLDTYSPSAIKTSYSKTVSLPDCKQNAEIFGGFRVKYDFDLFNDDGRVIEKGYCTLDSVVTTGIQRTFNITLYGGLGDFFYNLKGDEDKPKSLVDLYWGDVTGLTPEQENSQSLMTWDPTYVYNTWVSASKNKLWDTFRAVPCIYDDKVLDKELTIIPSDEGLLFPTASSDGSASAYVGRDGTKGLLVKANENTCYGKMDFRSELLLLGIKYKSIIEACCKPENNGGYEVTLDPDFFNAENPYWNNMFVLKGLPIEDYDFSIATGSYATWGQSVARVGNYLASSTSATLTVKPRGDSDPWEADGNSLVLNPNFTLLGNKLKYKITPFIQIAPGQTTRWVGGTPGGSALVDDGDAHLRPKSYFGLTLELLNVDTGETRTVETKGYGTDFKFYSLRQKYWGRGYMEPGRYKGYIRDLYVSQEGSLEGVVEVPSSWTNIQVRLKLQGNSNGFNLYHSTFKNPTRAVTGDFVVPSYSTFSSPCLEAFKESWNADPVLIRLNGTWDEWASSILLPDSTLELLSEYSSDLTIFEPVQFTKKDLLQGTSSPFDYLTWFTKMFNLRFYLEPGVKRVTILTADNFIRQLQPLNIQDRICWDKEFSRTRRIIDEGYLKFNLTPNSNISVENYSTNVGENLLDYVYPIEVLETKGEKNYLDIGLKIGSKGRNKSAFLVRPTGSYIYYGFNQNTPYEVSYYRTDESGSEVRSDERYLNYTEGSQRYDFLTLDEDPLNTVVLYSGLKSGSLDRPAIISRTSVDMVKFAGKPCWITGIIPSTQGSRGQLLGAEYIQTCKIPSYGLVPSLDNYSNGLSYSNVDYESLIVTDNIYDRYLKNFIERVYGDPLVVECYVRLSSPELRRLYWFQNNYWILTEISDYNYRDEPVKCKFIRYRTDV